MLGLKCTAGNSRGTARIERARARPLARGKRRQIRGRYGGGLTVYPRPYGNEFFVPSDICQRVDGTQPCRAHRRRIDVSPAVLHRIVCCEENPMKPGRPRCIWIREGHRFLVLIVQLLLAIP